MRKLMIAAVTALAFASAAHAGSPHCDKGKKPCDNTCIAQHLVCRAPAYHPQCDLQRSKPCENTCIPKHDDCHKG